MHPITFHDFADSPTLLLSPQHHPFYAASSYAHSYPYHTYVPYMPLNPGSLSKELRKLPSMVPPPLPPITKPIPVPAAIPSRKRQHDAPSGPSAPSFDQDEYGDTNTSLRPTRTLTISPNLSHGGSASITNPLTGQPGQPGARSNPWVESTLRERLGTGVEGAPSQVDGPASQMAKRQCVREESSSTNIIDFATRTPEYTQALGIGWAGLGNDPDVLAAARGYCRYLENHYPLTDTEILAKSSLEAYLVKTNSGYYLFNDDLTEGRLIAQDFGVTLEKLKTSDIQFDGTASMRATITSKDPSTSENEAGTKVGEVDAGGDVRMV